MELLELSGICKSEAGNSILHDISFSQQRLQKLAIAGETGSGKSTLLKIVAGLAQPDAGAVYFEQVKVKGPAEKLVPGHNHIAYLSQQFELAAFLRVEQVLQYANKLSTREAEALFELCRIGHLLKRKTDQLSGGERQRIALARLLLTAPKLLLLDEPFSNLDVTHKRLLKTVIQDIGEELKITCILVSHDPMDTLSWADEIMVLQEGQLVQKASPEKIYRQPANLYTAGLFGQYILLPPALGEAFTGAARASAKKKSLVRPENFRIGPADNGALTGVVKQVLYFGSHYELEVMVDKTPITLKLNHNAITPGDQVNISVAPEDIWHLPK